MSSAYQINQGVITKNDGTFVTTDTAQTISGTKTFSNPPNSSSSSANVSLSMKDTGLATNGTTPAAEQTRSFQSLANDGSTVGETKFTVSTTGDTTASMNAVNSATGNAITGSISVSVANNGGVTTSAPTPTDTTSTSSTQIATVGWVNSAGNNVVHLGETETISGSKTINTGSSFTNMTFKVSDLASNATVPSSNMWKWNSFVANDGSAIGLYGVDVTSTYSRFYTIARKKINGTEKSAYISTYILNDGTSYVTVPTPTDTTSTSSMQAATVGWANSTGNNIVHLSGTETITGSKTITSDTLFTNPIATNGTSPSSGESNRWVLCKAVDGSYIGGDGYSVTAGGLNRRLLLARRKVNGTEINAYLGAIVDSNGAAYATAPTPASSTDNSIKIATTAWCTTASKEGNLIGAPDWDSSKAVSLSSGDSVTANGWIYISMNASVSGTLKLNGVIVVGRSAGNYAFGCSVPTKKGDVITLTSGFTATFYPAL